MTSPQNPPGPPSPDAAAPPATALARYGRLWRGVPRELGFLVLTLPIAVTGFSVTVSLFSGGVGTLIVVVGFAIMLVTLVIARGFGTLELTRLEWAGRQRIERPVWPQRAAGSGILSRIWAVLRDGHYWLYLLHTMVVNFAVSLFTWIFTVVWVSVTFASLTFWFWEISLPDHGGEWYVSARLFPALPAGAGRDVLEASTIFVIGVAALVLLPFVTRGLVLLHDVIARVTLGAFASDALRRQVGDLEASRGAAISAEGHSLRRLERDIHDGPQQRLVRLQMDLSAADRQLDANPQLARELIAEAMTQAKDALEELRALSRGFAPPMLLDRGLVAALESAASRSAVPTTVLSSLPAGSQLPQEIERNAYFVASEALANAAKHSGARAVEVRVGTRIVSEPPVTGSNTETDAAWLDLEVRDDGRGGARPVAGHGLSGLDERVRGLGGTLEISSPSGGPTSILAHLPLTYGTGLFGAIVVPAASLSAPSAPEAPTPPAAP